jgi:hypothetical protein
LQNASTIPSHALDTTEASTMITRLGDDTVNAELSTIESRMSTSESLCQTLLEAALFMSSKKVQFVTLQSHGRMLLVKPGDKWTCSGRRKIEFMIRVIVQGVIAIQYEARFWAEVKMEKPGVIAIGGHCCFDDTVNVADDSHITIGGRGFFQKPVCVHGGRIKIMGKSIVDEANIRQTEKYREKFPRAGTFEHDVTVADYGVIEIHGQASDGYDVIFAQDMNVTTWGRIIIHGNVLFKGTVSPVAKGILVKGNARSSNHISGGIDVTGDFKNGPWYGRV